MNQALGETSIPDVDTYEKSKAKKSTVKKIKYNLNGHGQLTLCLYPYASKLYEVLCDNNYDAKFNHTNQLGALKRVLPGAHYTRYEYILLQWYLIHELKQRQSGTGLGSSNGEALKSFKIEELGALTGGDLLQCTVLLTNMGHFPDTFAASRVWLDALEKNIGGIKDGLIDGVDASAKGIIRDLINENDVYRIHYSNTFFMLERMKNSIQSKPITKFATKVFTEYTKKSKEELNKYWKTYLMIRNLAYIILDSSYAPIPLNIELASVLSSLEQIFGINLNSNNPMTIAIKQLDRVLEDTVYLAGNSLIANAIRSSELEKSFNEALKNYVNLADGSKIAPEFHKISHVRRILEPTNKDSNSLTKIFNEYSNFEVPSINWDTDNILEIKYSQISNFKVLFREDLYMWEKELHRECGQTLCNVSVFGNPQKDHLRIVHSRNTEKPIYQQISSLLKFIARIAEDAVQRQNSEYVNDEYRIENFKSVFEFVLKGITNWNNEFTFEWSGIQKSTATPFFFGRGAKNIAKQVKEYMERARPNISDDMYHELKCTRNLLKNTNYRGLILVYIGATKLWDGNNNSPKAEFDGIVIYPNKNGDTLVSIVEGKNKSHGNTEAKRQLKNRMKMLNQSFEYNLEELGTDGAYANVKFKAHNGTV